MRNEVWNMAEYMDIFNRYIMGSAQMLVGFHYFVRLLQRKAGPIAYLLFAACGILEIFFVQGGRLAELGAYTLLLAVCGIILCTGPRKKSCICAPTGHTDWITVVLYAVLTVETMQLAFGIVDTLLGILYPLASSFDQIAVGVAFMFLGNAALVPTVFCYRVICRYFSCFERTRKEYVLMILIPILLLFLVGEYLNITLYGTVGATPRSDGAAYISYYPMFGIQLLGMASLFCILYAYQKLLQNFQLGTELSLLVQQEHALSQYVEEARARYEKTKSFRHDIQNHIAVVRDLLRHEKWEQAADYVSDMEGMTADLSFPCSTNNPVVDILLGNKMGIAKNMGIAVSCTLVLPCPCLVRDIDFGIILSNALDNAIHACKRMEEHAEKYICVSGRVQGDFILIEVENSFRGNGTFQAGTGLANIRAVAENYHGTMSVRTQGAVFSLSVLLVISQQPESSSRQMASFTAP